MISFLIFTVFLSTSACYYPVECTSSSSSSYGTEEVSTSSTKEERRIKQINHSQFLMKNISTLCLIEKFSDVVLVVDNERVPAHRVVLASSSAYFSNLLYGPFNESGQSEVNISGIPLTSFKILLEYIYTGQMNLNVLEPEVIMELYRTSDFFRLPELQFSLAEYLRSKISTENVCPLFEVARLYQHKQFVEELLNFIEDRPIYILLYNDDYLSLSAGAIQDILVRDSFYIKEIKIFRAVYRWIQKNRVGLDSDAIDKVLSVVRYPLISDEELLEVENSQLVSSVTISAAKQLRNTAPPNKLPFRGYRKPYIINGNFIFKLKRPRTVNYIEMTLPDEDVRYYIEVSMGEHDWLKVIDYSHYICRSIQRLWILPRLMLYIRIVYVHIKNTVKKTCKFFKVCYNTNKRHLVEIINGLVAPKYNVTSTTNGANVIKGENNGFETNMLLHSYKPRKRHKYYTWHKLESGCIRIQLAQPYILSSMRILLWEYSAKNYVFYKYTVEVSVNNEDWKRVANKTDKATRSWQLLEFDPTPIVFIRIIGVHSSDGDEFRCVYLEAPVLITIDSNRYLEDGSRETDVFVSDASSSSG